MNATSRLPDSRRKFLLPQIVFAYKTNATLTVAAFAQNDDVSVGCSAVSDDAFRPGLCIKIPELHHSQWYPSGLTVEK